MADRKNKFLLKRSNVAGKIPSAGDLLLGEMALNTADVILYTSGTTANDIIPIGWDRIHRTGDTMTGPLYVPTISATTYLNLPQDVYITGSTLSSGGTLTLTRNDDTNIVTTGFTTQTTTLKTKSGIAPGSGFTGNPDKYTVTFTSAFSDNNYSVTITGEVERSWTIESKTSSGFVINSNANPAFIGDVFWQAIEVGEN